MACLSLNDSLLIFTEPGNLKKSFKRTLTIIATLEKLFGCCTGIELDSDTEDEESAEMSVKGRLLSLVVRVIGLKKKPIEVDEGRPQSASKCIFTVKALLSTFMILYSPKRLHFITFSCPISLHVNSIMNYFLVQD